MNRRGFFGRVIVGVAGWFGLAAVAKSKDKQTPKTLSWLNEKVGGVYVPPMTLQQYVEREFGKWKMLGCHITDNTDYSCGKFSGGEVSVRVIYSIGSKVDWNRLRRSVLRKVIVSLDCGEICEVVPVSMICGQYEVRWEAELRKVELGG